MESGPLVSRRALLRGGVEAGVGAFACALLASCGGDAPTEAPSAPLGPEDALTITRDQVDVDITRVPAFAGTGEAAVVFLVAQVIVVRRASGDFVAFSSDCPHAGCGVSIVRAPRLVCPCHGSEFDFAGRRVEGPAPTGLQSLAAQYDATARRLRIQRRAG